MQPANQLNSALYPSGYTLNQYPQLCWGVMTGMSPLPGVIPCGMSVPAVVEFQTAMFCLPYFDNQSHNDFNENY